MFAELFNAGFHSGGTRQAHRANNERERERERCERERERGEEMTTFNIVRLEVGTGVAVQSSRE